MLNFVQNGLSIGLSHERAVRRVMMFIILGLAASSIIMWQVNAQGYKEWLYAPFFLGLLLLLGKGTKPEIWSTAFLTGGAWNLTQLTNPLTGGAQGLVWWITKGLPGVIVFWLCLTGFLATWSFEQSPGAFFPIVGFGLLIFFALTAWDKWEGDWMFNIVLYYSIGMVILALLATMNIRPVESIQNWFNPPAAYTATGTNWWMNPANGQRFKTEPQRGCAARQDCYDEDHATDGKATPLVPWDAAESLRLRNAGRSSGNTPSNNGVDPASILNSGHFLIDVKGAFAPTELATGEENRIGPVGNFNTSCLRYDKVGGGGQLVVWTLPADDLEGTPIRAIPDNDGRFVFQHESAPAYMFFGAEDDDVMLSLSRRNFGTCS